MQSGSIAMTSVDNPLAMPVHETRHRRGETVYRMPQVAVPVSQRDRDQLEAMYNRRQIGKAALKAGHLYQTTYELARGLLGPSQSDWREFVDGGRLPRTGITDEQMKASDDLDAWNARLGDDATVAVAFLIYKRSIRDIADNSSVMVPGKASTTFHGHLVRRMLTVLAKAMGFG